MQIQKSANPSNISILFGMRIFDGVSSELIVGQAIVVGASGTITDIGPEANILGGAPAAAHRFNLAGRVLSPGLINMHVHFGLALPGPVGDLVSKGSDGDLMLVMADSARRTLLSGVTTVRLVGESRNLDFALRRGIEAGAVDGPRIFTAGHALCSTGGHGWDSDALEGDGADDFRRLTREQIREGADVIKICISGGIAGEHENISTPQLFDDEIEAVIEVAHAWGKKVTAHAGPSSTLNRAILLGLDCVEHGYQLTRETTELMAERDVWFVPTISVSRCSDFLEEQGVPQWMMERALSAGPRHWKSLQNAIESGVKIAMGTDLPPHAHFDGTTATIRELEFLVEAGMSALDALRSATSMASELLDDGGLGNIKIGASADFIATAEDPTTNISRLRAIDWVMKNGKVYRDDRGVPCK